MRKQNRTNKALKIITGSSGASLMFVLAIMLLLMAVGTSVLVSAGSNMNAGINKQLDNRLNIYADSMHRAIMSSLKAGGEDAGEYVYLTSGGTAYATAVTLGGKILGTLYSEALGSATEEDIPVSLTISYDNPTFDDGRTPVVLSTVEIIVNALVRITPYEAKQDEVTEDIEVDDGLGGTEIKTITISPEIPERLQSAVINGSATVTVTATLPAVLAEKSVISVVTYNFTGGFIKEDVGNSGNMKIVDAADAGDWRFLSRERVDMVA